MEGLHIHGVSHAYGNNRVLNNVSLVIPGGELVCLLGPSGCGKSTLLRLAAGLETLQAGSIVINDVTVAAAELHTAPEHRHIGLMFQDYALFPHLNVLGNVCFGLSGMAKRKARTRAMEMLDQVHMAGHAEAYPHMLSGGMQQRVALARALAPEPRLLLLDEPFSGLDTNMRAQIREDTLEVLRASGVATLMVTHDPEEAMYMADWIKILGRNGRILQTGNPHEIYYHPRDEFVARLFGLMNTVEGVVEGAKVETPFGAVDAGAAADGETVQVLIRPEGIVLESGEGEVGVPVDVRSTHLLGHSSVVRVATRTDAGAGQEFFVRVHKDFAPELAHRVTAYINPAHCFVFPVGEGGDVPGADDLNVAGADKVALKSPDAKAKAQTGPRVEAAE